MKIFARTLTRKSYELDVASSMTVAELKEELYKKSHMDKKDMILIFSGVKMLEAKTLAELGVTKEGAVINLIFQLAG